MKRGQSSVEFITIFGFIFLMMIPLIIVFFDQSHSVQDNIAQNHIRNIARKIADEAESMYYLGEPSKTTIKTEFPERIQEIVIENRTILFRYMNSKNTIQDVLVLSMVNLTGNLSVSPGIHYIHVIADGGFVKINET